MFPLSEPPFPTLAPAGDFAILDFDGDGYHDLAGRDSGLYLARGGPRGFGDRQTVEIPDGGYVTDMAAGDLTGDGLDDVVVSTGTSGTLIVARGHADGRLRAPEAADRYALGQAITGYGRPTALDLGDIDGDLDVVAGLGVAEDFWYPPNVSESGAIVVLVNDGTGHLMASGQQLAVNAPIAVKLVPLAGEDPDLVVLERNAPGTATSSGSPPRPERRSAHRSRSPRARRPGRSHGVTSTTTVMPIWSSRTAREARSPSSPAPASPPRWRSRASWAAP